jgi:hypothetical protein
VRNFFGWGSEALGIKINTERHHGSSGLLAATYGSNQSCKYASRLQITIARIATRRLRLSVISCTASIS